MAKSRILNAINTLRKDLFVILLFSITTIVLIDSWLIEIPELFDGGAKLGQFVYQLSFAYVSAFFFYFLVVHLKDQKDKRNLNPYINKKLLLVIGLTKSMINSMASVTHVTLSGEFPNVDELNQICSLINPTSKAPMVFSNTMNNANWLQYFDYYKRRSNEITGRVLSKMQFLDSELVNILAEIEDCDHFEEISMFVSMPRLGNTDLTVFAPNILSYFELISKLEKYCNTKIIKSGC